MIQEALRQPSASTTLALHCYLVFLDSHKHVYSMFTSPTLLYLPSPIQHNKSIYNHAYNKVQGQDQKCSDIQLLSCQVFAFIAFMWQEKNSKNVPINLIKLALKSTLSLCTVWTTFLLNLAVLIRQIQSNPPASVTKVKTKHLFSVLFIIFQRLSSLPNKMCILLQETAEKGMLGDVITSCLSCCWGHVNYENIDWRKYVWSRLHFVHHFSRKDLKDLGFLVRSLWSDFALSAWYTSGHRRRPQGSVRSDALLNSTSTTRSCRSELTLWKSLSFGRHGFPAVLTDSVTQFHTQQLSICIAQ